jgi:hypothetical protein
MRALVCVAVVLLHGCTSAGGDAEVPEPEADAAVAPAPDAASAAVVPADAAAATAPDAPGREAARDTTAAAADAPGGLPDAFFGDPRCDRSLLFCDGFESGAIDATKWSPHTRRGALTVDAAHVMRGKYALHVHVDNPYPTVSNQAWVSSKATFKTGAPSLFVRMFIYVQNEPDRHNTILTAYDPAKGVPMVNVNLETALSKAGRPNMFRLFWYEKVGQGEPTVKNIPESAPYQRWQCWEWQLRGDGSPNVMNFWLDDRSARAMTIDDSDPTTLPKPPAGQAPTPWTVPTSARLQFGSDIYHPDTNPANANGFDLWIDEIAVGSSRVGCAL